MGFGKQLRVSLVSVAMTPITQYSRSETKWTITSRNAHRLDRNKSKRTFRHLLAWVVHEAVNPVVYVATHLIKINYPIVNYSSLSGIVVL